MHPSRPPTAALRALACALALLTASCAATREIRITSTPPGAEVRVDGEALGHTPLRVPFEYYGARRVTLYLDGYFSTTQVVDVDPPWYAWPLVDFVTTVILPVGWKDIHRVHVDLEPGRGEILEPDLRLVLERADILRLAGPGGPEIPPTAPAAAAESRR